MPITKPHTITARVDVSTRSLARAAAESAGQTLSQFAGEAIRRIALSALRIDGSSEDECLPRSNPGEPGHGHGDDFSTER